LFADARSTHCERALSDARSLATTALHDPLAARTQQNPTVQVALSALQGGYIKDCSLVLCGALISTLPILLVFVLMGRRILGGIMQGAVKG
jgi:cellobiose transport system permease protein